jgi:hypothetical protein
MHSRLRFENPPALPHDVVVVAGSPLLGLTGLSPGHTARRFGQLSDEAFALVKSLATRAEADPTDVDGRACDGFDDVRSFLYLW